MQSQIRAPDHETDSETTTPVDRRLTMEPLELDDVTVVERCKKPHELNRIERMIVKVGRKFGVTIEIVE